MKRYQLHRKICSSTATLGRLYNEDMGLLCSTLENPWLNNYNDISCIPEGIYKVERDTEGKHQFYKLTNTINRLNIEIHIGNFARDTAGCILFGENWAFRTPKGAQEQELSITYSARTLDKLLKILPEKFELEILRSDYEGVLSK
jgi:hypothetical protein